MGYYNGKKVLSVVRNVGGGDIPEYEGSYTITANGTYPTSDKRMVADLAVNVPPPASYAGSYTITANGTYSTGGKLMDSDLVVDVPTNNALSSMWERFKANHTTTWAFAFGCYDDAGLVGASVTFDELLTLDFSGSEKVNSTRRMFKQCRFITSVPWFDTSNVTNMEGMFIYCSTLVSVPAFDCSKVNNMGTIFDSCRNLASILMINIKANLSVSATALDHDALVTLIGNLYDFVSAGESVTRKLTIGSEKLALLSDDEKQVATDKGWTLA